MQDKGLLPTFDERQGGGRHNPSYGTELQDHASSVADEETLGSVSEAGPGVRPQFSATQTPESKASKVFRVTTLEDRDYDSIPHQRLKAVIGGESWLRRLCLWVLILICGVGIAMVVSYMDSKKQLRRAVELSNRLSKLDTSNNDIMQWLKAEKHAPSIQYKYPTMGHPKVRSKTVPTGNPRNPLAVTHPHPLSPRIDSNEINNPSMCRLPVGLATTMYIERLVKSKEWNDDITQGHDSIYHNLKALRQALPVDLYQSTQDRKVQFHLLHLLRMARQAGVVTDVPLERGTGAVSAHDQYNQNGEARKRLIAQLTRFVLCKKKGAQVPCSQYKDVMSYPKSSSLLYWGSFSLLQFNGEGVLYWDNGLKAYNGTWVDGTMNGMGTLYDHEGLTVWSGQFKNGQPVGAFGDLWSNYYRRQ